MKPWTFCFWKQTGLTPKQEDDPHITLWLTVVMKPGYWCYWVINRNIYMKLVNWTHIETRKIYLYNLQIRLNGQRKLFFLIQIREQSEDLPFYSLKRYSDYAICCMQQKIVYVHLTCVACYLQHSQICNYFLKHISV